MHFGVDLFWPALVAVAFAAAAIIAHVVAYRQTSKPIAPAAKLMLLSTRIAAVAVLVFVLWRPAAEKSETLSRKQRLALLVDASKSMSINDEESGTPPSPMSRTARAANAFSNAGALWRSIADSYEVSAYSFAGGITPLAAAPGDILSKPLLGTIPDGPLTALGDAIQEASRAAAAPEVILVVSDGISNSGIDPVDAALPGGAAIYTISVGRSDPSPATRDVAATGIFAPPDVFVSSEANAVGTFLVTGLKGAAAKVHLLVDGREAGSKDIAADRQEAVVEAEFKFRPEKAGPVRLEMRADPLPGEIIAANNSIATYVDVKKGRMKVLYIEGTFRWEAKFIRLALESARDVDLRLVLPKGDGDAAVASAIQDEWDVLIIGDLPSSAMAPADMDAVAKAVAEKGKGLLFLGGANAFGRGGWAATPLAALAPFEMKESEGLDTGLFGISARPEGPYAGIVGLGEGSGATVWETLPPVLSANRVGAPKPGASVLLMGLPVVLNQETGAVSGDPSRTAAPVLAVEDYGKGRTAAVTAEGTWRWATGAGMEGSAARDAAARLHRRFWRQLAFWLARREERGGFTVALSLPRHRVEVGRRLEMEARLFDPDLRPLADGALSADVSGGGKSVTREFWLEGGVYKTDFKPPAAGDYTVRVTARRGGKAVAEAVTAFVAEADDVEFATFVARPALLEAIARSTGGAYAPAAEAARVLSEVQKRAKLTEYVRLDRRELWSSYWYLAVVLGLLTLEWITRKLLGLV